MAKTKEKELESELVQIILNAPSLQGEEAMVERMHFLSLAHFFDMDFKTNLELGSAELSERYRDTRPSDWLAFLKFAPIRKYLDDLMQEKLEKAATKALTKGGMKSSDAIKIHSKIRDERKKDSNVNIVVMFLPQKDWEGQK